MHTLEYDSWLRMCACTAATQIFGLLPWSCRLLLGTSGVRGSHPGASRLPWSASSFHRYIHFTLLKLHHGNNHSVCNSLHHIVPTWYKLVRPMPWLIRGISTWLHAMSTNSSPSRHMASAPPCQSLSCSHTGTVSCLGVLPQCHQVMLKCAAWQSWVHRTDFQSAGSEWFYGACKTTQLTVSITYGMVYATLDGTSIGRQLTFLYIT